MLDTFVSSTGTSYTSSPRRRSATCVRNTQSAHCRRQRLVFLVEVDLIDHAVLEILVAFLTLRSHKVGEPKLHRGAGFLVTRRKDGVAGLHLRVLMLRVHEAAHESALGLGFADGVVEELVHVEERGGTMFGLGGALVFQVEFESNASESQESKSLIEVHRIRIFNFKILEKFMFKNAIRSRLSGKKKEKAAFLWEDVWLSTFRPFLSKNTALWASRLLF